MKVLVVVAHPDDEVLGCGGTLARHIDNGDKVSVLIISDGITARYNTFNYKETHVIKDVMSIRESADKVKNYLNIDNYRILGLDANRLDTYPILEITKFIEENINTYKPEIIYTHHPNDINIDHKIVFNAVQTATRPINKNYIKKIMLIEVLSSSEWNFMNKFDWDIYVDISKYIDKKVKSMKLYNLECRNPPHPRCEDCIRTLAKKRGYEVGLEYAETFKLLREVI